MIKLIGQNVNAKNNAVRVISQNLFKKKNSFDVFVKSITESKIKQGNLSLSAISQVIKN